MTKPRVDYDRVAPEYDRRYSVARRYGRVEALLRLASRLDARRILEVGCGTGYWLAQLRAFGDVLYGLDPSTGMLKQAQRREGHLRLTGGRAEHLPFREQALDLVFCVQAIHHFAQPQRFVDQAYRVLEHGGALAIVGSDQRHPPDDWYVYNYFEGTLETDLRRKPSWTTITPWLEEAGFVDIGLSIVEEINDPKQGRQVLRDPFLRKNGCSQLALLTDEAYALGLARIKAALAKAAARGESLTFPCRISIAMLTGHKHGPEENPGRL